MKLNILMIDDNSTELLRNEILLKKNSSIDDNDTLYKYQTGESFLIDYANWKEPEIDIAIIDHNLGLSKLSGYEIITEMQMRGFLGLAILLTGDDSREMKNLIRLTAGITYICKSEDVISKLTTLIQEIREGANRPW